MKARDNPQSIPRPHNLDAEKQVLGAILVSEPIFPEVLGIMRREDFYHSGHQKIFAACWSMKTRRFNWSKRDTTARKV